MFENAKTLVSRSRLPFLSYRRDKDLTPADVQTARDYIAAYWKKLERFHPKDDGLLIGVPKPYLVPSYAEGHEFDYNELFYWDSYFMVQGKLNEDNKELVMGILEDLESMYKRFKIIPNGSQLFYTARSQPPFLTSFIFDVYHAFNPGEKWLKENI